MKKIIGFFGVIFVGHVSAVDVSVLPESVASTPHTLIKMNDLCALNLRRGEFFAAEKNCVEAKATIQKYMPGSLIYAKSLENLARFFKLNGFPEKALAPLIEAFNISNKINTDRLAVVNLSDQLARVHWSLGNLREAKSSYIFSVNLVKKIMLEQPNKKNTVIYLKRLDLLGWFYLQTNEKELAKQIYDEAIALAQQSLDINDDFRALLEERRYFFQ